MKIIRNNAVYVQKSDIGFLKRTNLEVPASIFMKYEESKDNNKHDLIKYDGPNEMDYLKQIEDIVDYDEVKDLSEEELITLLQNVSDEYNFTADSFNEMSLEDKIKHIQLVTKCILLECKFYSLSDILEIKQGKLNINFPEEENKKKDSFKKVYDILTMDLTLDMFKRKK